MTCRSRVLLLVAIALSSSNAASLEACSASTDTHGTCTATREGNEPHFRIVEGAQDRCPEGFEITSAEECRDAIQSLGLKAQMATYASEGVTAPHVYAWSMDSWPVGCSHPHQDGRPSFGVFNSDEAGKGGESVSLICRISVWTPPHEAASSVWIGEYERLEESDGCPADSAITSAAECAEAILSLGLESDGVIKGQHTYRPWGCSYNPTGGFFNTWELGQAVEEFDPICRKVHSVAELPVDTIAYVGYEGAMDLWDDLEVEGPDFAEIFIGDEGFDGGLTTL